MNRSVSPEASKLTSLGKGLYLLSLFAETPRRYTVAQLASRTGLNRTTVYRMLSTLEQAGLLIFHEADKTWTIGPLAYRLGSTYLINADYKDSIRSILESIAEESKESVGIAHRDGDRVVSIYSVESHQPVKINDQPGTFYPMYKGCYGKCLMAYHDSAVVNRLLPEQDFVASGPNTLTTVAAVLAEYEKIRRSGQVESIEETAPYIIGGGLPLKSADGTVSNVVAISFFKQDDYRCKLERMFKILRRYQPELEHLIP